MAADTSWTNRVKKGDVGFFSPRKPGVAQCIAALKHVDAHINARCKQTCLELSHCDDLGWMLIPDLDQELEGSPHC